MRRPISSAVARRPIGTIDAPNFAANVSTSSPASPARRRTVPITRSVAV